MRYLDRVRGWAAARIAVEGPRSRIGNVAPVVGAVRVLTVPARGEGDDRTDAARAEALGQRLAIGGRAVYLAPISGFGHAASRLSVYIVSQVWSQVSGLTGSMLLSLSLSLSFSPVHSLSLTHSHTLLTCIRQCYW